MDFKSFHFHPHIAAGVQAAGYTTPTPVQLQSIPPILQGRDIMALAQTGTGKTAAFVLPILQRLMQGPRGRLRALIIAPTRELAEQIHDTIGELGRQTGLRSVTIYGGVAINPQIQKLRRGAEIAVACPGRLLDHIRQGTINTATLEILVLDEADRMFDMGFLPDIRKILKHLPAQRQTLFFSATMPSDIRHLAHDILRDPVTVQIDHTVPLTTVSHALYPVDKHLKTALLMEILHHTDTESVLVFTRTKHRARQIARQLKNAGHGATSLQGNLSQNQRQAALDGFRDGSFKILVATDIAARGIDVSRISHVINYDIPDTAEAYTHRIGRTGRAAKTGDAFTLVTREDASMVRTIESALGVKLERRTLKDFTYTAPAQKTASALHQPPRSHKHKQATARRTRQKRAAFGTDTQTTSFTRTTKHRHSQVSPVTDSSTRRSRHSRGAR
ncbi:MAG: RNA helicase [Candidatus Brocadia sp.]|nr:ATP-dependent RNA helicase RhlE [Candidatus Brocadia fulgida]MCC6326250.1 DEAD/DEAH box helicase [Candidatus Brocadia sp.]MCE7910878.1 DEAD/DEAH box helicase [Candidatus Brocadia sp. AMX3]MDG5996985.1 DEAD/DEAH box helicase [Candidatus Brocadia sp.]RIK00074.1 MAG: RNA helicase [Candidatus Brocadia sp.]